MDQDTRNICAGLNEDCFKCEEYKFCERRRNASIKERVHTCLHCGNIGVMKYVGETGKKPGEPTYDNLGNEIPGESIDHEKWHIFECPVCRRPIVIYEYSCDVSSLALLKPELETRYPTVPILGANIPLGIYDTYMAAVRAKGIDYSLCLQSLRSVLEKICKDKGETTSTLEKKIQNLINKKVLPPMFEDACWIIRKLGNEAAHGDNVQYFEYEVEQVITYISEIINYLYCLPSLTASMRQKIVLRLKDQKQRQ